jgi:excisionase family DNA binding protein
MIGRPAVILQIPDQRVFSISEAAKYIGVHEQTLRDMTDLGQIKARKQGKRRAYLLEELDRYVENLPEWNGEEPPVGRKAS